MSVKTRLQRLEARHPSQQDGPEIDLARLPAGAVAEINAAPRLPNGSVDWSKVSDETLRDVLALSDEAQGIPPINDSSPYLQAARERRRHERAARDEPVRWDGPSA